MASWERADPDVPEAPVQVSVVIVNYNVREFLRQALNSVTRALAGIRSEVFVVDNNSVDGSVAMVSQEFPDVQVIANRKNVGFAAANNQAIRKAKGEYLLILNPDTVLEEDTIRVMADFLDAHPRAGAVGCRILNPDGTYALESRRSFPTPQVAFYRMTGLSRLFPRSERFGRYNLTYLPVDRPAEVDALSGSCMMVRSESLHRDARSSQAENGGAGLLDEDFFMYGEDLDWCYRIQQAGWSIHYTPATQIIHYKGESTKRSDLKYVRLFYGAMLHFANKHLSEDYPKVFLWTLRAGVVVRGALSALGQAIRHLALYDFLLTFLVVAALGLFRSAQTSLLFPGVFYWLIAPLFGLITVAVIAAIGGYQVRRPRFGAVSVGVGTAVLVLAAVSFFVKQVAFSRAVVLASFPATLLVLSAFRLARYSRRRAERRTVLVGDVHEVQRLERALAQQDRPQFALVGFVMRGRGHQTPSDLRVNLLGRPAQLRDIVRIHDVEDVIFAAASLSNKRIFALMQRLGGLPVQSRILAEDGARVIGKASVDHLGGAALLKAEEALGSMRSAAARRVSDVCAALVGALLHPFVSLAARMRGPDSAPASFALRTSQWSDVLFGRCPLVGYDEDATYRPPKEWQLQPGVFAVSESLGPRLRRPRSNVEQAYWYYVRHQSALLDWLIAIRALRTL